VNLNQTILLTTIVIICVMGAVEGMLIFGGTNVITLDNSTENNVTNDTNLTDSDDSGSENNNPTNNDPVPNLEPEPPENNQQDYDQPNTELNENIYE